MKTPRLSTAEMAPIRKRIIARDGHVCVKCGRPEMLEIHHIQALMDGGNNDDDNLITLCAGCHAEWGAIEMVTTLDHDQWMKTPPYIHLYMLYSSLPDNITLGEARKIIQQNHSIMHDLRSGNRRHNMAILAENNKRGRAKRKVLLDSGEIVQVFVSHRKANEDGVTGIALIDKERIRVHLPIDEASLGVWHITKE